MEALNKEFSLKNLNKEIALTEQSLEQMSEELFLREEMHCKGNVEPIHYCDVDLVPPFTFCRVN